MTVKQGAGKFNLDFSAPNPVHMGLLEISSGAAGIELGNLANANFSQMRLSGGTADYELDFGGALNQDAEVMIKTGLSGGQIAVPGSTAAIEIGVPSSTAAKIVAETTLGSVDVGDGFTKSEAAYFTKAGMAGKKPFLTIRAWVRLGAAFQLRTT